MQIKTVSFAIETNGRSEILDITPQVQSMLNESQFKEGNVLVFVPGSTAGITTIEYEPGLLKDYPEFMEQIIPTDRVYNHDEAWHDGNGHSHLRASLQGASLGHRRDTLLPVTTIVPLVLAHPMSLAPVTEPLPYQAGSARRCPKETTAFRLEENLRP